MTMNRPTENVVRQIERDVPRDRGCTIKAFRNRFCGSCGCGDDSSEDNFGNELPSSSSGEYRTRKLTPSATGFQKGVPIEISSITLMEGERAVDISKPYKPFFTGIRKCCSSRMGSISSDESLNQATIRKILINEKQTARYPSNVTTTAKYTTLTFLPIFLYEQFRRYSNLFFLAMAILQQIPGVSPTGRYITLFPLLFILIVSGIKEIAEDLRRHRADKENNIRSIEILTAGEWKSVSWAEVHVGDIVKVNDKEYFPADLVLLVSSKPDGMCFVQTANLDGETNLKIRKALSETMNLSETAELSELSGVIECEPPNRRIYDFFGVLKRPNEAPVPMGPNQFLQRGAALSNTKWIIGIVIYSGHETKLMKSFARGPLKCSSVDRLLNKQFISLFALFIAASIISAFMNLIWILRNNNLHTYLELRSAFNTKDIIFNFLSFLILYNNFIPISLQVTLEMVHYFQAIFINSDIEMYHEETDTCAVARTSNLNEELGMVQYVLTDKTGTLTCNIMKFKKCSIAGILYDLFDDSKEMELIHNLYEEHPSASIIKDFMLALTLCHSVVSEVKDNGTIVYHATNPDDQAIIEGAKECGYIFLERGTDYIDIMRLGRQERYKLLGTIEFTSSRKCMSVLVRMPDGNIKLFSKGADSVIFDRLSDNTRDYYDITKEHLGILAAKGYRTLCCTVADISEEKYREWIALYKSASVELNNREEEMESIANQIEQNLTLLGVTAIEDKLQDGVQDTISFILAAGIRVWMLTGDKQETAINIAFASGLLNNSMHLTIINEESLRGTFRTLRSTIMSNEQLHNVALVIDGKTLQFALRKALLDLFKNICLKCRVVICCRLSPLQKGELTDLVNSTGACTLAIGDGANDVTMIRKANVGIGISGLEGHQAACASDYSIAQFRYLKRLLFVHGTWNYRRIITLTLYCFYKNIILCIILMWFCFYNGWSAQVLFDRWIIAGYNVVYTSWPPLAIGIFDKVCSAKSLLKYPQIYSRTHDSKLFNVGIFWIWILNAIFHSILLFWIPLWLFGSNDIAWPEGHSLNLAAHGNMVYTTAVTTVCLKAGLTMHSWNYITHISIWGSIVMWFVTLILYSYFWPTIPMGEDFSYSHAMLLPSCIFWLFIVFIPVVTLLPDFFLKAFFNRYFMTVTEIARQEEQRSSSTVI